MEERIESQLCQLLTVRLGEFLNHVPKPPFPARSNMYANWSLFQLSSRCRAGDQCSINVSPSSLYYNSYEQ